MTIASSNKDIPKIDFDAETNDIVGLDERMEWWYSTTVRQWLSAHGYILFGPPNHSGMCEPVLPSSIADCHHPYARYFGGNTKELAADQPGRVAFAQDTRGRHVVIKIVKDGTNEYRAYRFLHSDSKKWDGEFRCVLPPVDLLECDQHWFVVMPRWGEAVLRPRLLFVGDVLKYMNDLLKGLNYLHTHRISHGDIKPDNTLVDHFSRSIFGDGSNCDRPQLRQKGLLTYALFDFDRCTVFSPHETSPRLPCEQSFIVYNSAHDTDQGEIDYDPFAFDVGCMGGMFYRILPSVSREVPMLIPLLNRMTTWKIQDRFTASEALHFMDQIRANLPDDTLTRPTHLIDRPWNWNDTEKEWEGLPAEVIQKWAPTHKTPPVPLKMRVWRRLCQNEVFLKFVIWAQRKLAYFTRIKRLISRGGSDKDQEDRASRRGRGG